MSENNEKINVTETAAGGAEIAVEDASAVNGTKLPPASKIAAEREKGVYVHRFREPFEHEGKKYETIKFNFGRLTGRDMINIEIEMQENGEYAISPEYSRLFQCHLASKAGGIGKDVMEAMPLVEFNRITNETRNFLVRKGF